MGRAITRSFVAVLIAGSCVSCQPAGGMDDAPSRHDPILRWTYGRSWVPGRVPGRADHEEPEEGMTQSYSWRNWEVEVEPAEVTGYPGQIFIVDVHMRPIGEVEPVDLLHGKWMWFALAMGTVQLGVPYVLFIRALRTVPATDVALIPLVEPILNPVWVWLVVHETPHWSTLLGGALILIALLVRFLGARRAEPAPAPT